MTIRGQISLAEATLAPRIGSFWASLAMNCENRNIDLSCDCGGADYNLLAKKKSTSDEFIFVVIFCADLVRFLLGDEESEDGTKGQTSEKLQTILSDLSFERMISPLSRRR